MVLAYKCIVVTENAKDFPIPQLQLYALWFLNMTWEPDIGHSCRKK